MSWITTYPTGKRFDLLEPKPNQIDIRDIAWSLSNLCRFTGHCSRMYSVAEHSLLGAMFMPTNLLAREFLLHDAAEAYTGDMSSPLKMQCNDFITIQNNIDSVIRHKFWLPAKVSRAVKDMDFRCLLTEKRDLLNWKGCEWDCLIGVEPLLYNIPRESTTAWVDPNSFYTPFLKVFKELYRHGKINL